MDGPGGTLLLRLGKAGVLSRGQAQRVALARALAGILEHMEVEGDRARARVGGKIPATAEVTPQAAGELRRMEGGPVWVSIKATELTVYPA